MDNPDLSFPAHQFHRAIILVLSIIFQILLIFQLRFVNLFFNKEQGFLFIALLFLFIFGLMFYSERNPVFRVKKIGRIIELINSYQYLKALRLFLFFSIPITLFGILIRILVIQSVPIDPKLADMLPLIQKACIAFLQGQNPYQVYYFPYAMPLTFWPGLWLPFLPAVLFGFDLRWIGLIFWGIISIIFILFTIKISKRNSTNFILLLSSFNILLLQISINLVSFHGIGHTFTLWLWLVLLGIGIIDKKNVLTAIALGLVISSRQTAIIYIPILMIFWYRNLGWKTALKLVVISFAVFSIITIPFIIQSPYNFIFFPILHYQQLAKSAMSLNAVGGTSSTIGFSYMIQKYWGSNTLSIVSGLVIMLIAGASFIMVEKTTRLILFLAASVTLFTVFAPIPWVYEYYPALLFLSLAIIS